MQFWIRILKLGFYSYQHTKEWLRGIMNKNIENSISEKLPYLIDEWDYEKSVKSGKHFCLLLLLFWYRFYING